MTQKSEPKGKKKDKPLVKVLGPGPSDQARLLCTLVEVVDIASLNPDPANARLHGEENLEAIAASLRQFGQDQPLVVQRAGRVVRKGNGRMAAMKRLGWTQAAVVFVDDDNWQAVARALADNRTAELATWDAGILANLLRGLRDQGKGQDANLGWSADDVEQLLKATAPATPGAGGDDFDPTPEQGPTRTHAGELWVLGGKHRLLVGDCTVAANVERLLAGARPFMMVTDPPYGVEYDPEWREGYDLEGAKKFHQGIGRSKGKVTNDDQVDWTAAYKLFTGDVVYVWHSSWHTAEVATSLLSVELLIRAQIIWNKQHFVFSRGAYHWKHEPCWYAVRKGSTAKWVGERTQSTVWDIQNANPMGGTDRSEKTQHSTEKPIECMARPIRNHGAPGDIVYDPFLGSGTTIVAAHRLGRICYGCELEPRYADVILKRAEAEGLACVLESQAEGKAAA